MAAGLKSRANSLNAPQARQRSSKKRTAAKVSKALRRAHQSSVGLSYIWGPKIFFLASCFNR